MDMKEVFQKHLKTFALETLSLLGTHLTKAATDAKTSKTDTIKSWNESDYNHTDAK